jgi:hypothetical protein
MEVEVVEEFVEVEEDGGEEVEEVVEKLVEVEEDGGEEEEI